MTIFVSALSRCPGGEHITLTVSINGSADRSYPLTASDLTFESVELEDRVLGRLVSACKEANANTPQKVQQALVNKTFEV